MEETQSPVTIEESTKTTTLKGNGKGATGDGVIAAEASLERTLATLNIDDPPVHGQKSLDSVHIPPGLEGGVKSPVASADFGAGIGEEGDYTVEDIEPVDPWDENNLIQDPLFTEEELVSVLRSFDDEEDSPEELLGYPKSGALPDLDVDLGRGEDSMLLPPGELSSVFGKPRDSSSTSSESDNEKEQVHQKAFEVSEDEEVLRQLTDTNTDSEELGLLEGLEKLNLDWQPEDDDFDVPPYMYCQPCTPLAQQQSFSFSLAAIANDEALLNQGAIGSSPRFDDRPKLPDKEFDTLLHLSIGNDSYLTEKEMDSLFEAGNDGPNEYIRYQQDTAQAETSQHEHMGDQNYKGYQDTAYEHESQSEVEQLHVSQRPEALEAAAEFLSSFETSRSGLKNERSCLGHKETIFGTSFSECGRFLATASQDSSAKIWNVAQNSCVATLTEHSKDYECLRVAWASSKWGKDILKREKDSIHCALLATAGADGTVKIWSCKNLERNEPWTCRATLDHSAFARAPSNPDDEAEKPQVYALQWIDHWGGLPVTSDKMTQNSFLLTSSDDLVHLWEIEPKCEETDDLHFREVFSLHFVAFQNHGYGVNVCQVTDSGLGLPNPNSLQGGKQALLSALGSESSETAFGGDRNPNNMIFVFDAVYCAANGLLGVALADGSLRLCTGRGMCLSIMQLPGCQSHLTSFAWDATGTRLATCVATGHVVLWGVKVDIGQGALTTSCSAILEGGHQIGRPVFGSRFCGSGENLLITWGVDGRLCLWDSLSQGNIHAPITILVTKSDYPIYAVDIQESSVVVGGGGGGEISFMGVPVFLYDIETRASDNHQAYVSTMTNGGSKSSDTLPSTTTAVTNNDSVLSNKGNKSTKDDT